ncbi:MAG: FecR domain-containing protein [Planctomycetales bacterium]|nr:FecR domain-containing protein [Planctomycetales bacterium]
MALSPRHTQELQDLLSDLWDRGPSPDRIAAIERFVAIHGQEACQELLEFTSLHSELVDAVSSSRAYQAALECIASEHAENSDVKSAAPAPHGPFAPTNPSAIPFGRRPRSTTWLALAAVAAAAAALIAIPYLERGNPALPPGATHVASRELRRPPQPVARVIREEDATWSGNPVSADETLKQGQMLNLERGTVQISMACGADIVLTAPCVATLVADDQVRLERGVLTAQAAAWATGFAVETRGLRVTDLGTRFAISADVDGVTEAHVLEGSVLVEPIKSLRHKQSSMTLQEGQAIRVSLPQSTIELIAAKKSQFIDHLPNFRPLRPVPIWNTGLAQRIGDQDLHWNIVAGAPGNGPYPRPAIITAGDPLYLDNMPDASQWISVKPDLQAPPKSVHTFETRFDLTGYDLSTVRIVGLFLVDDAMNALRINGQSVPFKRWATTWDVYDFTQFRAIEISEGFVPGENVISIDLFNSPSHPAIGEGTNPTGLRVEWQAFGCEAN